MDATSTFDFGGLSGAALGNMVGMLVGVLLLMVVSAFVVGRALLAAAASEPVLEPARA